MIIEEKLINSLLDKKIEYYIQSIEKLGEKLNTQKISHAEYSYKCRYYQGCLDFAQDFKNHHIKRLKAGIDV